VVVLAKATSSSSSSSSTHEAHALVQAPDPWATKEYPPHPNDSLGHTGHELLFASRALSLSLFACAALQRFGSEVVKQTNPTISLFVLPFY